MEITGILKVKGETVQVSEKFKKREFVITDNTTQYPQHLSIQLTQDKIGLLDKYNVGDEIKAHINLRGREWVDPKGDAKYFNSIEAWRIEGAVIQSATEAYHAKNAAETANTTTPNNEPDDLPF